MRIKDQLLQVIVMGRPVIIGSAEPALLAAAVEAYGEWPRVGSGDGAPIRLTLEAGDEAVAGPVEIEVEGSRLRLSGGAEGWADARALTAGCKVSRDLMEQPGRLAREVIDTLLLFLLTRSGRISREHMGRARQSPNP